MRVTVAIVVVTMTIAACSFSIPEPEARLPGRAPTCQTSGSGLFVLDGLAAAGAAVGAGAAGVWTVVAIGMSEHQSLDGDEKAMLVGLGALTIALAGLSATYVAAIVRGARRRSRCSDQVDAWRAEQSTIAAHCEGQLAGWRAEPDWQRRALLHAEMPPKCRGQADVIEARRRQTEQVERLERERAAAAARQRVEDGEVCAPSLAAWRAEGDLEKKTVLYEELTPACRALVTAPR